MKEKYSIGSKVNVNLTDLEMVKLGIATSPKLKNPCTVKGYYTNGLDGIYLTDSENRLVAIGPKYGHALELASAQTVAKAS